MPSSQYHPDLPSEPPPSYSTVELQDIDLERYTTLPTYSTIVQYRAQRTDRKSRNIEKYHHWWRLRDSILTGFLCVAVWFAYGGVWIWRKRREETLTEEEHGGLHQLLHAQLPSLLFTFPTILSLPLHYLYLAAPHKKNIRAWKTVPIDIILLLGWGGITAWIWLKTPFAWLEDAELVFYWGSSVSLCIALGVMSTVKLGMRIPWVMERMFGGRLAGK